MKRWTLTAIAVWALGAWGGDSAADDETRLPHPAQVTAGVYSAFAPRFSQEESSEEARASTLESTLESGEGTCEGDDETLNTATICQDLLMAGAGTQAIRFEGENQSIEADNLFLADYAGGKVDFFCHWDETAQDFQLGGWHMGVPGASVSLNTNYFLGAGSTGLFLAMSGVGTLMIGEASGDFENDGCTMMTTDPASQGETIPAAVMHLETEAEGTKMAVLGLVDIDSGEGEGEGEESFQGFMVTEDSTGATEVTAHNTSGVGLTVDSQGNVIVQLRPQ